MKGKRVAVAMSGGVDSSVAAVLLKEKGYDVVGLSMQLWNQSDVEHGRGSCCSTEDIYDARRVADSIGIPFYVINMQDYFETAVVDYFITEYLGGRTPNPCVRCNELLKFDLLLKKAVALEADYLATGHYARITHDPENKIFFLHKGKDPTKDQSYFLFTMTQSQLSRVLFPVGDMDKSDVRSYAGEIGLRVADKKESQEVCFVTEGSYRNFIKERVDMGSGEIVDVNGRSLGLHSGISNFTIGQRKGIGLSGSLPYYVVGIDTSSNKVIVGHEDKLFSCGLVARKLNWMAIDYPERPFEVKVKMRYQGSEVPATLYPFEGDKVKIVFNYPQKAVTPGQAVVFYRGEVVMGGGWIEASLKQ